MTRSKPFSGKQKKAQLQAKKDRKRIEDSIEIEKDGNISLCDKRKLAQKILERRAGGLAAGGSSTSTSTTSVTTTPKTKVLRTRTSKTATSDDSREINHHHHTSVLKKSTTSDEDEDDEDEDEDEDDEDDDEDEDEDEDDEYDESEEDYESEQLEESKRITYKNIDILSQQLKERDMIHNNSKTKQRTRNNLVTIFEKESRDDIQKRKDIGKLPLDTKFRERPWEILDEHRFDDKAEDSGNYIDIPKRPLWDFTMGKEEEKRQEQIMFKRWLDGIAAKYDTSRLNYFEHNLEVWRQLWRVCERSDIILLVTDARYPLFHFPPALYHYIKYELKKPMLMVLNKVDLVDKRIVDAWIHYFNTNYSWVKVICFSSFRPLDNAHQDDMDISKRRKFKRGRKNYGLAGGKKQLVDAILSFEKDDKEEDKPKENCITIGTVGHPNVGKSSLINGLMGKKVVSTSRTPGHTKHFQTIFLTKGIVLCDCPGLVFPALDRPKSLQVLCGLYPIAQVREPYSAIRYLADRVPIEKVYGLQHPDIEDEPGKPPGPWSPYAICQALARKRGYFVAKSGREDVHRAGLELLRDCVDGNIVISWPPPDFTKEKYQEIMSVKHTDYLQQERDKERGGPEVNLHIERVEKTRSERKEDKKTKRNKQLASALANHDSDYEGEMLSSDESEDDYRKKKGSSHQSKQQNNKKSILKQSPPSPPPSGVSTAVKDLVELNGVIQPSSTSDEFLLIGGNITDVGESYIPIIWSYVVVHIKFPQFDYQWDDQVASYDSINNIVYLNAELNGDSVLLKFDFNQQKEDVITLPVTSNGLFIQSSYNETTNTCYMGGPNQVANQYGQMVFVIYNSVTGDMTSKIITFDVPNICYYSTEMYQFNSKFYAGLNARGSPYNCPSYIFEVDIVGNNSKLLATIPNGDYVEINDYTKLEICLVNLNTYEVDLYAIPNALVDEIGREVFNDSILILINRESRFIENEYQTMIAPSYQLHTKSLTNLSNPSKGMKGSSCVTAVSGGVQSENTIARRGRGRRGKRGGGHGGGGGEEMLISISILTLTLILTLIKWLIVYYHILSSRNPQTTHFDGSSFYYLFKIIFHNHKKK
ncbi:guanine nucleotide binding protein 1 [Cavenderia fasciculata]|uniref:Guanine nucleotide-binding protein-like 1 n=1 Tax=Cavenderia fasciculata TaxID=261658 RepID=F4PMX1_CACFS|nr:guanine nucleotide binding protein 1 [Cavenderia fasciculata]EGG22864.1 guanine nucleotide binding protein 1 [Cavenderia fasciculata]|eukprot:XP_004360715.1 guanine nucleotide binding protein 1 [Cavenderia fasciculata]